MADPYLAYCVDEAAALAGAALERRVWEEARATAPSRPTAPGRTPPAGPATLDTTADGGPVLRGKIPVLKRQPDGSYR